MNRIVNNELVLLSESTYKRKRASFYEAAEYKYTVEINGTEIQTYEEYFDIMGSKLKFPWRCEGHWARYKDFMTDLSWLGEGTDVIITIFHFDKFLKDEPENKFLLIKAFYDSILPFWELEVDWIMAPGKRREIKVFLVSDDKTQ